MFCFVMERQSEFASKRNTITSGDRKREGKERKRERKKKNEKLENVQKELATNN